MFYSGKTSKSPNCQNFGVSTIARVFDPDSLTFYLFIHSVIYLSVPGFMSQLLFGVQRIVL